MIAYRYSDELQLLCDEYAITLVDPMKELPHTSDHATAFKELLIILMVDSRAKKFEKDIDEFFKPVSSSPRKVISKLEIHALEITVSQKDFSVGINLFREICDSSVIPADFEDRIVSIYYLLARKVITERNTEEISSAIFNLKITNPVNKLKLLTALMATANVRTPKSKYGDDHFLGITTANINKKFYHVVAAKAVELVYNWGWNPSQPLSCNVHHWIEDGSDLELLPIGLKQYVNEQMTGLDAM
ncbi:hypothetical protein ACFFSY_18860 [Paenibacillus aurantiacus]|uniref:Uncharacterized protein n=1 Tax=Paenibacillus aurantiacus TaxID=1936118 RepID=A0ABV5KRY6_9BACL